MKKMPIRKKDTITDIEGRRWGRRLGRTIALLLGASVGPGLVSLIYGILARLNVVDLYQALLPGVNLAIYLASGIGVAVLFYMLSDSVIYACGQFVRRVDQRLRSTPTADLVVAVSGLLIGLAVAFLISNLWQGLPILWLNIFLSVLVYLFMGWLGVTIMMRRRDELKAVFMRGRSRGEERAERAEVPDTLPKLLDTNVLIDGRIFDIVKSGFVEGPLVVPAFILSELRYIADSADTLRRNRGRRGLDVLSRMQKELPITISVEEYDRYDNLDADARLIRMAHDIGAKIITNDYNLNKVAAVQDVDVLNINELANAVKPVVLPGEVMVVKIMREGKEAGQGVAYLDDGTMVVIEDGRRAVGQTMQVTVTTSLQTAAGRMVFARIAPPA